MSLAVNYSRILNPSLAGHWGDPGTGYSMTPAELIADQSLTRYSLKEQEPLAIYVETWNASYVEGQVLSIGHATETGAVASRKEVTWEVAMTALAAAGEDVSGLERNANSKVYKFTLTGTSTGNNSLRLHAISSFPGTVSKTASMTMVVLTITEDGALAATRASDAVYNTPVATSLTVLNQELAGNTSSNPLKVKRGSFMTVEVLLATANGAEFTRFAELFHGHNLKGLIARRNAPENQPKNDQEVFKTNNAPRMNYDLQFNELGIGVLTLRGFARWMVKDEELFLPYTDMKTVKVLYFDVVNELEEVDTKIVSSSDVEKTIESKVETGVNVAIEPTVDKVQELAVVSTATANTIVALQQQISSQNALIQSLLKRIEALEKK